MDKPLGFFAATGDGFEPLPFAASAWSPEMVNGPAITGLLARELEREHCPPDFTPVRLTVDLFRPTRKQPMTVATRIVRSGKRIVVADAELLQDGAAVARASAVFLLPSAQPPGAVWTRERHPEPPPLEIVPPVDARRPQLWGSGDEWTVDLGDHENAHRKRSWQYPLPVVLDEPLSPFAAAAVIGESTSMMTNWGSEGIGFINADLTLALARPPEPGPIGVEADNHISAAGIAVGSATLFDRNGSFGTCIVTALSNAQRQISFVDNGSDDLSKAGIH